MGTSKIEKDFQFFQKANNYRLALGTLQSDFPDWRSELPDLAFANDCVLSALVSVFERSQSICPLNVDKDSLRRAAVAAAMFQNISLVETAVSKAQYIGASALIRQELEGVEVLRGILAGKQKDGATPRLKAFKFLGKGYSQLTGVSHLSLNEGITYLTGGRPFSYDPRYNKTYAEWLMKHHVLAVYGLATITAFDFRGFEEDHLTVSEEYHLTRALKVLGDSGFLQLKSPQSHP
ncbi:hypothetical protein KQ247_13390 [Ruegeria pomeroyi]|uniref:Uncharacterized protein n=1 Tax=Ruegeria pomeroyi TaxID=89184 RepID=A0A850LII0_9RHOB|nr:hypothetical protein [Ruegeria pomeroyi]NVK97723.1 hypothetical protein [Ruegeria pomeroyi]NVL00374.1 hypothetical protein [Ruegeria pomeroyi]QWV07820.1 hypothetical protein KQ247_13390 [Ruegeria pomeroyi]HCE72416.1 hypothetical protein [Ruegeria sp.]